MSFHFHALTVKEVKRETPGCVSVLFDVPEALQSSFAFQQGQNLTIKKVLAGSEVRRSYSICTAPYENKLQVAIKKVDGGLFSAFANEELKAGDVLEVLPPTGKFNTVINAANKKNYLAFAAGSGITPVISIIKTVLKEEPQSSFTLVYGNKNRQSIIFFEELEALKNTYMGRFSLINILSREKTDTSVSFGRIDKEKLELLSPLVNYNNIDEVFICGPEEMIFTVKDYLEQQEIDKKKIHFELFTSAGQKKKAEEGSNKLDGSGPACIVVLKADGRSTEFIIPLNSDITILDAALKQGSDLPYACKGGMCCTCKAKLLEGEVDMDVNWGLEHEEVEQGFILTCQSHPKTERVVVDFDVK
jgi:ring-1,2-phenylacetyl-CoA epoxidase subunit PaaE